MVVVGICEYEVIDNNEWDSLVCVSCDWILFDEYCICKLGGRMIESGTGLGYVIIVVLLYVDCIECIILVSVWVVLEWELIEIAVLLVVVGNNMIYILLYSKDEGSERSEFFSYLF